MTSQSVEVPSDPGVFLPPWTDGVLSEWSICGMNHYHVAGEKFLFVSMTKDGRCVTEEGKDDAYLWNRLLYQVWNMEAEANDQTFTI